MAKKTSEYSIELNDLLSAIDNKNRVWWDKLSKEQQDKFNSWLYMRYASSVTTNEDFSRFYLMAVNEVVNKKFTSLKKHPKLQYLLLTAASPGLGKQRHIYVAPPKAGKGIKKRYNLLSKLFPMSNNIELEILNQSTDDELKSYLESLGWTDKEINLAIKKLNSSDTE